MSETANNIYDLNKLEDMFEVIDSLTRATAVLANADRQLAGDLVKLTNTLINLSETGQKVGVAPESHVNAAEIVPEETSENGIVDLTFSAPSKSRASLVEEDEDVIVDVLTGEKIRK